MKEIFVVKKFPNVFANDILGLPFARKIELAIDLELGAAPVHIALYWMAPVELKEFSGA